MGGRADFYEKYLEAYYNFQQQGWNVTAMDWRGQGGSGRCTPSQHIGHIADFEIWVKDLTEYYRHWHPQNTGPHVLLGHSMGGHLVARALAQGRIHPDAAILCAPMLTPQGGSTSPRLAHLAAKIMCWAGKGQDLAWKVSEKPLEPEVQRQKLLTHDWMRYSDEFAWFRKRPELRLGPASWRWVERAYHSARQLRDRKALESMMTPILVLATKNDALVDHATIERAVHLLPKAEMKLFGDECAHEIFREVDAVRNEALNACYDFLDRVAPVL